MKGREILLVAIALSTTLGAQSKDDKKDQKDQKAKDEVITLTGCVEPADKAPGQYTLEDKDTGVRYRLTGTKVRDYAGKTVLIVGGSESKKLVVKGGLLPNPNVAAQAGSMDPARAAVASQPGSAGPGTVELPEFRVKSVRPTGGGCR